MGQDKQKKHPSCTLKILRINRFYNWGKYQKILITFILR